MLSAGSTASPAARSAPPVSSPATRFGFGKVLLSAGGHLADPTSSFLPLHSGWHGDAAEDGASGTPAGRDARSHLSWSVPDGERVASRRSEDEAARHDRTRVVRKENGFSLVEIIAAVAISSLVTLMLGELIVQGYKNYRVTADQTTQVAIARRTQDTIVKELREAIVSDKGDYPLIKTETNRLEFYSDIDRDDARERLRYWRENNLLKRGTTEPVGDPPNYRDADEVVRIIAQYLTSADPIFRYYKNDGIELTPPLDVTAVILVGINFAIDVAPGQLPRGTTVNTVVELRNIKAILEE